MPHFLCRLNPPRATFAVDMTADEAAVMQEHVAHWTKLAAAGSVVAFGPVADPAGPWGLAIVDAEDGDVVDSWMRADPVNRLAGMTWSRLSMPRVILGARPE